MCGSSSSTGRPAGSLACGLPGHPHLFEEIELFEFLRADLRSVIGQNLFKRVEAREFRCLPFAVF